MVRRLREYPDALAVPKRQDEPSTPAVADDRAPYGHTLSMRLPMDQYRRLRRWAAAEEERTGRRIIHTRLSSRPLWPSFWTSMADESRGL